MDLGRFGEQECLSCFFKHKMSCYSIMIACKNIDMFPIGCKVDEESK